MLSVFFPFWEISKEFTYHHSRSSYRWKSFANIIKTIVSFESISATRQPRTQTRVLLYSREMCKHGNTPNIECNTFALRLIPGTRQNNLRGDRLAFWNWANGYGDYGRKQKVVVVSVFWIEIGVYKFQIRESYEVRPK